MWLAIILFVSPADTPSEWAVIDGPFHTNAECTQSLTTWRGVLIPNGAFACVMSEKREGGDATKLET